MVEPLRTHSNLPCRPASPFITVVRGGSVWSNRPELSGTWPAARGIRPTGQFRVSLGWSGLQDHSKLSCRPDSRQFRVSSGWSGLQDHSKLSCRPDSRQFRVSSGRWFQHIEPSRTRDCKVFRLLSHEFGVVRLYRTFSNYISSGDTRCAGCNMHRFGEVQEHQTSSNLLELHPHRDSKVYRILLHEFGVVR